MILSLNIVADDKTNFPQKLLSINRQVENIPKAFANKWSTGINLSKTQLSKMIQSGGFIGRLLCPWLKTRLPLTKNVIKPLAKRFLISLGLATVASVAGARIIKKILGSACCHSSSLLLRPPLHDALHNTTLIISNNEMKDIIEIVKSLGYTGLLFKGVSETI